MENGNVDSHLKRFGIFEADLRSGELRKAGLRIKLQEQPFKVLVTLLERPGQVVTREELRDRIWPEESFGDFDHAVNIAIAKLRTALNDSSTVPRFVETLPRRGYRFIAPVIKPVLEAPSQDTSKRSVESLTPGTRRLSIVAALLALLSGIGVWRSSRSRTEPPPTLEVVPLATLPGHEIQPAFSPDGNQVAFVLKTTEIQNSGIYTTMVGGERSLQLTKNPGDYFPAWSPDGRQVAFYRFSGDGMAIYTVPALGGTEQRLYVGRSSAWTDGLSWSPDGKVLAFSETVGNGNRTAIALISLADSTTRQITAPPSGQEIDISPAFSPDGSSVAFVRSILAGVVSDLYVVPSTGGAPKRLTFDQTWIKGSPSWTPDGQDIVFASARGGATGLWRISSSGGVPRAVEGVGATAFNPSIAPKGNQLVYQQFFARESIRRINLKDETHRQGPPTVLSLEKGRNWRPDFSPDGKRFAFESTSSGHAEIWACDSDGAHCGRLTSLHGTAGAPRWSPDGHYIAFEFRPKDRTEIYLLEASGGRPRLLPTLPGADNGGPRWSRDGKWIYFYSDFYSDRGGEPFQLWKVPVEGGAPVRITSNGGLAAAESSDGRFLYFCKFEALGIWKMPLQGGEEERILDQGGGDEWYNWALAQKGIYFLKHYEGEYVLTFFDFAAGKTTPVSSSERIWLGLTLSADDRSLLYSENELEDSTIMLVKNFH